MTDTQRERRQAEWEDWISQEQAQRFRGHEPVIESEGAPVTCRHCGGLWIDVIGFPCQVVSDQPTTGGGSEQ